MSVTVTASKDREQHWYRRLSRAGRLTVWCLAASVLACLTLPVSGVARGPLTFVLILCCAPLPPLLLILLYRWVGRRMLWKVRNRLILTYVLLGVAPVVLFGSLGAIALYLLAGQYSASTVLSSIDQAATDVSYGTLGGAAWTITPQAQSGQASHDQQPRRPHLAIAIQQGASWHALDKAAGSASLGGSPLEHTDVPSWLHAPFQGIVARNGQLWLCSEQNLQLGTRSALAIGVEPLNPASLDAVAHGLGRLSLFPGYTTIGESEPDRKEAHDSSKESFALLQGGVLPPPAHLVDTPILFSSPVHVVSWETGRDIPALMVVVSRPALLYRRLFSTSINIGTAVRVGLIAIATLFALFELVALILAIRLSRTITRSVDDLYRGTRAIDAGHLDHRIPVPRRDQLAALASSFNGMAESLADLLQRQREEERLRNELAIAQEVQMTLFPQSPASVPGLELHAVCRPAQVVGGDYFDFIFGPRHSLYLAFGDISGKGVSAALLMASLHSAVRAFCLGGDDTPSAVVSPAHLLKSINRHLFCSTQSARYATLFLAWYDQTSRELTYANAGHLPPVILSADGRVRHLDSGGPVVGLLEHTGYTEETIQLNPGDLLIAFTDGLTEPEDGLTEFGEQRLIDSIRVRPDQPLPLIVANTIDSVQRWIGNREQPDDMTMLVARQL